MNINDMTIEQLAARYNEIAVAKGKKAVKKFSSKSSARQRVREIEVYQPFKGFVREPRKNSLRMEIRDALRRGCIHEDMTAVVAKRDKAAGNAGRKGTSPRASRTVRTLCKSFGYGLELRGDKLFLIES